jgi:hypothetical protein
MVVIRKPAFFLLPFALVASAVLAEEAPPPAEAPKPDTSIIYTEKFAAPTGTLTSVADLRAFVNEFSATHFDTTRAAKVEGLTIKKESCEWKLDGFLFLRGATRGIRTRAMFFGKGTYKLTPPIPMEAQQVRRFLGTDAVDVKVKQCTFTFFSADDQQAFEAFAFTPEIAAQAKAENEDAKKWIEDVEKYWSRPQDADEVAQRQFRDFGQAASAYERILEPGLDGRFSGDMQIDLPDDVDKSASHLVSLSYDHGPQDLVEVSLDGVFDHGDKKYGSRICEFNDASQYAGNLQRGASSPYLETERKDDLQIAYDRMHITFDPGGKSDVKMVTDMDLVVGTDKLKALQFGITPFLGCTKATFEGQPVEFFQPNIPGYDEYHAPFIIVALPRAVKRGDKLKVTLELEGKILYRVDPSTWMVKEEDAWFPNPSSGLGGLSTRFETTLSVPKGYTAIANGLPGDCPEGDAAPGMDCFYFKTNTGIDFATFNIGNNMRIDKGESIDEDADRDGKIDPKIPIRVYTNASAKREFQFVDPDNPAIVQKRSYSLSENGPDIVGRAQIAHKVYTDWFGPCPYDTLMITPHPKGHGRGSASLLLIAQGAFLSSTAFEEFASLSHVPNNAWEMTHFLTHEIAHQWWGGAARIRGPNDQWFSEGFADYSATLVLEEMDKINHSDWFGGEMAEFTDYLLRDDGYVNTLVPLCLGNRVQSQENRHGYEYYRQNFMYSKGAYVMHMLRMLARARMQDPEKGDALFKQAWHDFMKFCETKAPSNNDMEMSLAKTYGMPMDWFFNQWVYGMGVPHVDWSYKTESRDGGWFVTCHVKQKDTNFQFPLAVSFFQGKQESGFSQEWVGKAETDLEMGPLPFKPERIEVNKDMGVLGIFKEVPWQAPAAAAGQ